jgi:acetylornithine deacetylase/succinyl-diaminopimelate desuccinylase-like protein
MSDQRQGEQPPALSSQQLEQLYEFLRIPSVSANAAHTQDVRSAAEWVAAYVKKAGGDAQIVELNGRPLVDGFLPAQVNTDTAPTVLCYGHFDVQPPEPLALWESDPFSPTIRDGWLYARGVADDKGQLWALLSAASDLAADGRLPVNVRFCCDGEEEIGGSSIVTYLKENAGTPTACLIFDSAMLDPKTPVFLISARGMIYIHVEVKTGSRDLHSGIYGGAALNALHVLITALASLFDEHGQLKPALQQGVIPPTRAEVLAWQQLPPGSHVLNSQGAEPADPEAEDDFYERTWARPSIDINGIEGGSPIHTKTIVPSEARANLSMRLAPGQREHVIVPVLRELLEDRVPPNVQCQVDVVSACDPALMPTESLAIQAAASAVERVMGRLPLLLRSGGSLPLFPMLERLGIPTIVTGFDLPEGNIHSANERMRLANLATAVTVAREMFISLGSSVAEA